MAGGENKKPHKQRRYANRAAPVFSRMCENCGRDWFATKHRWCCPWCGHDNRVPRRGYPLANVTPGQGWKTMAQARAATRRIGIKKESNQ